MDGGEVVYACGGVGFTYEKYIFGINNRCYYSSNPPWSQGTHRLDLDFLRRRLSCRRRNYLLSPVELAYFPRLKYQVLVG
jgi:hypothetical protein